MTISIFLFSANHYFEEAYFRDFKIRVHYWGSVYWQFGGVISTGCKLSMTYFPFDKHFCPMVFQTWVSYSDTVKLSNFSNAVDTRYYEEHGLWNLSPTFVSTNEFHIWGDLKLTIVMFGIPLSRKEGYYIFNILAPCFVLTGMLILMFWLPVDSGEKTGLGVTLLLAFTVFQLMVAEITPRTSDTKPLLGG